MISVAVRSPFTFYLGLFFAVLGIFVVPYCIKFPL